MDCLRLFHGRCKSKRRPEAPATSFSSTVSTEARSSVSVPAANSSNVSSANATSHFEPEASGARPVASGSSGSASSARSILELYEERSASGRGLRDFGLRELCVATRDFSPLLVVGEGGFGCVYRGVLRLPGGGPDGTPVAVKRLNPNCRQGHKEWLAEVHFLGVVEHRNLIKLIGFCASRTDRGPQRLLVYEFMPNKTLDDHLFNRAYSVLPWEVRLQIALGAAEGLLYLHEGLELQVMGAFGYAAPDYVQTGHLTTKSDVWSFGVVLYKILTARRSIERNRPKNEQRVLEWVRRHPAESKQFGEIMDARLEGRYPMRNAREVAKLANRCLAKHAKDRPTMREVVERLKQAMLHTEMDGVVDAVEQGSPVVQEAPWWPETEDACAAAAVAKRRMLHLDGLEKNADVHARRRLMLVRASAAAAPT